MAQCGAQFDSPGTATGAAALPKEGSMQARGLSYASHLPPRHPLTVAEGARRTAGIRIRHQAALQRRPVVIGKIPGVIDVSAEPEFQRLRHRVREAGCDCLRHFANGYTHEGGLALQQNPDEFAALCLMLKARGPFHDYLEIGSASGGEALFLSREVGFERALVIDDRQAMRAPEQAENFAQIPHLTQFVGDSHSLEARRFLEASLGHRALDLAFIDGDHSAEGIWEDLELTLAFSQPGTVLVLHDTMACEGVETAWLRLVESGLVTPLAEFVGPEKPLGIGVAEVRAVIHRG